ncbi:MAG: hypothetical protein EON87_04965 [Brevundimonas sp.]|nr:MAG: hypothetical protein EON87_04965 [Brevundimonas sp.]
MLIALALAAALNQLAPAAATSEQTVECRYQTVAETRIPTRVCMSRADWAALKTQADDDRARHRPVIDNRRPGRGIGRW